MKTGDHVRWKRSIYKSGWSGVVTGFPEPRMVEVDHSPGWISEGLLQVVDEKLIGVLAEANEDIADYIKEVDDLEAERDALVEVVAMQTDLIGTLQSAPGTKSVEWHDKLERLLVYYLTSVSGVSNPPLGEGPLRALVAHIRGRA